MKIRFVFGELLLGAFLLIGAHPTQAAKKPVYNEVAVDIPLDGGGLLMWSHMWAFNKRADVGFTVGGGVIQRDFDLTVGGVGDLGAHSEALILPYIGPRLAIHFEIIGISLGFGAFYADSEIEVDWPGIGTLKGEESAFGIGFYSPFLTLDFYDKKRDLVYGFGLGGFFESSYPDITVSNSTVKIKTDSSPVSTLTFHVRVRWWGGRAQRLKEADDF